MGTDAVVQAAEQYGKGFICSEKIAAVDLQDICNKVRTSLIEKRDFFDPMILMDDNIL